MRLLSAFAGLALVVTLAGCSGEDGDSETSSEATASSASETASGTTNETSQPSPSAQSVADEIATTVDVEQVVIDENNDPNDLIGRPNGYVAAVLLKDSRLPGCTEDLGVDCGATVEEWPNTDSAQARADYIAALQKDSPMLGSEYHYLVGPVLVRVSGELKPSQAMQYEGAIG